ncbi:biosynthetic-type acetolactate synthase large subunit [Bacillus sp. OK048]|uniref:biosynthetic-type acetolactate synthase large subunit n=1 Tax=Bacillus sp. OK048 TaxID=1882761 RepID=UPI000891BE39|nr:biosynthetic-type acetolactate synthase large subunit [Bacillus sp. OK048]SDL98273.1 acetolactate synthase, large subunit [Bacillus sp. OK048]
MLQQLTKCKTGGEIVVECLSRLGVDLIFGYPGGAILPVYDALYDSGIKHILTRHEQAAIHAAEGYARATGKPGTVIATSGPGATNLVTGIADAYMDSTPLVIITGQVSTSLIGKDAFQETDILSMTMPITKHNYQVRDAGDLSRVMAEAYHIASTGRPGPVLVDIPKDVGKQKVPFEFCEKVDLPGYKPIYEPYLPQIEEIALQISKSRRPLLYIGGGVIHSEASEVILKFAKRTGIPVVSTLMGLGNYPQHDPLFIGMLGMHGTYAANKAVKNCDLLIACGVRFDDRVTGKIESFSPYSIKVHIDIDSSEIGKNVKIDYPLVADLKKSIHLLDQKIQSVPNTGNWLFEINQWKQEMKLSYKEDDDTLKPQTVINLINEYTNGNAIITTDVGQHQMWAAHYYQTNGPRRFITSGGLGTMGFGLPAAIGAQFANLNETVICISGDGSFQMNIQELQTIFEHKLPIKIYILNNGHLGLVRQLQKFFFNNRVYGVELSSPDFVKVAEGYQIKAINASNRHNAETAIIESLRYDGPVLVNFFVTKEENVYPMVPPEAANEDAIYSTEE